MLCASTLRRRVPSPSGRDLHGQRSVRRSSGGKHWAILSGEFSTTSSTRLSPRLFPLPAHFESLYTSLLTRLCSQFLRDGLQKAAPGLCEQVSQKIEKVCINDRFSMGLALSRCFLPPSGCFPPICRRLTITHLHAPCSIFV